MAKSKSNVLMLLESIHTQQSEVVSSLKRIIELEEKIAPRERKPAPNRVKVRPRKKGIVAGKRARERHKKLKKYSVLTKVSDKKTFVRYKGKSGVIVNMKLSTGIIYRKGEKIGLAYAIGILLRGEKKKNEK